MVLSLIQKSDEQFNRTPTTFKTIQHLDRTDAPSRESYDSQTRSLLRLDPNPSVNNLLTYRWRGPGLTAAEEADLVHRAQADDKRAGRRLVEAFHHFVLERAGKHRGHFNYNNRDELVAAGMLAFWACVKTWKPGYRLATHCWLRVPGAISDESKRLRKRGIVGETLFQRIAFSGGKARQLRKTYRSFGEACEALKEAQQQVDRWTQPYSYETTGTDDPDKALWRSDDADFKCTRWTKRASRKRDRIDELALDADKHAAYRLEQIGRRAYALELVEKQQRQLDDKRTRYPDYLWFDHHHQGDAPQRPTPPAPADRRKTAAVTRVINHQRIKPRIRVWRAA